MDRRSAIFAALAVATGIIAYAIYFDHKRRNDVDFRKELSKSFIFFASLSNWSYIEKDRKRVKQSVARNGQADALDVTFTSAKDAFQAIKNEEDPKSNDEKESYFLTQVGVAEQLALQGP
jgi:mitochondrial import receptor subunit TOM20